MRAALAVFRRVIAEHNSVSEFIRNLNQAQAVLTPGPAAQRLQEMAAFLRVNVRDHFAYEEEQLFAAMLAVSGTTSTSALVRQLREEHKMLLAVADRLDGAVAVATEASAEQFLTVLAPRFRQFFAELQRHAALEDKALVPLLAALLTPPSPH